MISWSPWRRWSTLALAALPLVACSSTADSEPLARVDPCRVLSAEQLGSLGLPPNGTIRHQETEKVGCTYPGTVLTLTVYRVRTETLEAFGERGHWSEFAPIEVNGHRAARVRPIGATPDRCTTMVAAGGGVVMFEAYATNLYMPVDGCGESARAATMASPVLPR